jgi:OFA family oxalate/formate antiporter-like MFS transporter
VRNVTLGAGVLLGIGFFLTAHASNLAMLYLCAGILVGFADGTGYLMTLSNCVKWFPERKGLISACSIGAYGLGSLGFKYINLLLLSSNGLETTFQLWGLIAMSMVLVGGMLMKDAPKQAAAVQQSESRDFTLAEAMRKPQYWMLALMFLTACMSGLLRHRRGQGHENMVGLPAVVAANVVAIIAMANLGGRLVLGILSDKMSRIRVITIAQLITLAGMRCCCSCRSMPTSSSWQWPAWRSASAAPSPSTPRW